ncbi:hypothetical protein GL50803_0016803 [Giardia duodenalis]|uniref:Uncharacterized protein n=1 Tax=Giardia intestinalis (strain ATCC 50803 / WB clone C6) TaxID=184922 RepID=A8B2B2_GIAIC|nr:hypothetical protein GL50803_0016803 [Giardia intestinalis]KAE8302945.1 hypothetical protein GL50803_0016803 [Giardia intestinalis]|eukprot:XP_001709933.1 Hypothetical protein GL50803_16803 [Giardia lamblia ATCC 50803]
MGDVATTVGYSVASVFILIIAAICSGLNLGLLGIDDLRLGTLQISSGSKEEKYAKRILPLLRDRHLVLVTLLLFNALCMELLPILLEILVGHFTAILISVTGVLLFGEIVPQSIFHRYSIPISATLAPVVWIMIFMTFSISFPLARLLDLISGKPKEILFRREELRNLLNLYDERNRTRRRARESIDQTAINVSPTSSLKKPRSTKSLFTATDGTEISQEHIGGLRIGPLPSIASTHARRRKSHATALAHKARKHDLNNLDGEVERVVLRCQSNDDNGADPNSESNQVDMEHKIMSIIRDPSDYELLPYEISVMKAALRTGTKHMKTNIVPLDEVYALAADKELNKELLREITERGHSRIPVYSGPDKGDIVGLLRTKSLINHNLKANETVFDVSCHEIMWFTEDTHLYMALEQFKKGRSHMAAVVQPATDGKCQFGISSSLPSRAIGIITLEDVIECIIGTDITDETDLEMKRSDSSVSSDTL